MFNIIRGIILIILFSGIVGFAQKKKSPSPEIQIKNFVTDQTGTLTSSQISNLESKLSNFEKETSNQIVVYMTSTLGGESLEETSYEIAEKNGIGQKGKNNGVLLFIAKDDRKLRIEVGYGLEGALPDVLCDQIIRKDIAPLFKQGKFYEGIDAGIDAIVKATKGEYKQDKKKSSDENDFGIGFCCIPFPTLIFFVIFGIIFFFSFIRRLTGLRSHRRSNWFYTGGWGSGSSSSFGGFSGGGGSFGGGGSSGSW
jgi:uncharacterized protein